MNEEQKKKAEAEAAEKAKLEAETKAKAEADAKAKAEEEANASVRALAERDEQIAKLKEERDNYKNVALKRLGKLEGDAGFIAGADKETGLTVEEQVKKVLLEQEISRAEAGKDTLIKDQAKKISELTLALKNRPGQSFGGGGSGGSVEVKDNVFSEEQLNVLRAKAKRLNADPEKFIENAKKNLARR